MAEETWYKQLANHHSLYFSKKLEFREDFSTHAIITEVREVTFRGTGVKGLPWGGGQNKQGLGGLGRGYEKMEHVT